MVAIVTSPGATGPLRPLAGALARHVRLTASGRSVDPVAVLASDPAALDAAIRSRATVRSRPSRAPSATAVVTGGHLRVSTPAAGRDGSEIVDLALPGPDAVSTSGLPPLTPHVRRRWRHRLGLAPDLVVDTAALAPEDVPTALAVAAAAMVDRRHLAMALALGCPSVTDAASAAAVGARDGREVVVGGRSEAEALAADDRVAAALSRRARALAVATLDPDVTAARVLDAWGLSDRSPLGRVDAALAELGTAPGSVAGRRAAAALALLAPTPSGGQ